MRFLILIRPGIESSDIQADEYLNDYEMNMVLPANTIRLQIICAKKGPNPRKLLFPFSLDLGQHAEVDWMEAWFFLNGIETKAYLFVMKPKGSGGYYVRAYPFAKQEAFFDGHRKCFEFMGGIPNEIAYDNLKTAVKRYCKAAREKKNKIGS